MRVPTDKQQLRQKRIMTYFVDAANQLINEEGLSAVTIRKVADLAGYNSATLYNYFDNLNHLIFLASMGHLEAYNAAVPSYLKGCKNPLEVYLAISDCFCKYSFASPELYELLFFSGWDNKLEAYTRQYYMLFPEREKAASAPMAKMIYKNDIYSRNALLLASCVDEGYMTQASADDFNEVALMIYRCILQDVKEGRLTQEAATEKNRRHYRRLLSCYVRPEHRALLVPGACR